MMRRQRAFTLVELMIVLMIISLLAAMLFPVFARARESARKTSCLASISQMGVALQMYASDWQGNLPPKDNDWSPTFPYVKSLDVFECPSDPKARGEHAYDVLRPEPDMAGPPKHEEPTRIAYSSYIYRSGLTSDGLATAIIAFDRHVWHLGGRNVTFLDGHAKWYAPEALWLAFTPRLFDLDPVYQDLTPNQQKTVRGGGGLGESAPWRQ